MGTLNDWLGTIGGAILALELLVLLMVAVGINVALLFGLRWVRGKSRIVREKRELGQRLVTKAVDRGASVVAAPVIVGTSIWRGLEAGCYRATHWPPRTPIAQVPSAIQRIPTQARSASENDAADRAS